MELDQINVAVPRGKHASESASQRGLKTRSSCCYLMSPFRFISFASVSARCSLDASAGTSTRTFSIWRSQSLFISNRAIAFLHYSFARLFECISRNYNLAGDSDQSVVVEVVQAVSIIWLSV